MFGAEEILPQDLRSRTNITAALINSEGLISLCISELELKLILKKICWAVLKKIILAVLLFEQAEGKQ